MPISPLLSPQCLHVRPATSFDRRKISFLRVLVALCAASLLTLTSGCALTRFFSSTPDSTPAAPAQAPPTPQAVALVAEARTLWDGQDVCKNPERALDRLDAALALEPDYATALLWRGRALSDAGYNADAVDDLNRSIQLEPTAQAYAARALVNLRLYKIPAADRDVEAAIKLDAKEPRSYLYRAASGFLQDQPQNACRDLDKACSLGLCAPLEKARKDALCK